MADVIRRILGLNPAPMRVQQEPIEYSVNKEGTQRVMMYPDTSANAMAARFNQQQIYGQVAPVFGMKPVIEVRQADGSWIPVTGKRDFVPSMDAQIQMLQGYNETGKLGFQPLQLSGDVGQSAAAATEDISAASGKGRADRDQQGAPGPSGRATVGGAAEQKPGANPTVAPAPPIIAKPLALPWQNPNHGAAAMKAGLDRVFDTKKAGQGPSLSKGHTPRAEAQSSQQGGKTPTVEIVSHAARAEAASQTQPAKRPWMRQIGLGLF